jgi:hypothetical protein
MERKKNGAPTAAGLAPAGGMPTGHQNMGKK